MQRKLHFFNENHKEITLLRNNSNAIEKYNRVAAKKTCFGASKHTENTILGAKKIKKKLVFLVLIMAGINVTRLRGSGLGNRVMLNTNINTSPLVMIVN